MKLCINCDTLNDVDAVFCSKCSMSLMGAPTGEEAMRLAPLEEKRRKEVMKLAALEEKRRDEAQTLAQQRLTLPASDIVYVYGHLFAPPWGAEYGLALGGRLLLGLTMDAPLDDGGTPVWLPYSARPVPAGHLGPKLLEAAFVCLAHDGYISLGVEKTKTLFASQEVVTISRQKAGDDLPPSLERSIMDVLTSAPQERRLKYVVGSITKGLWMSVVAIVMQSLCEAELLGRPEGVLFGSLAPTEEAAPVLAAIAEEAEIVKARLETFAAENPHLQRRLVGELMQLR